jgi:hypothetical protein
VTFALMPALLQQIPTVDRDIREGRWQTGVGEGTCSAGAPI